MLTLSESEKKILSGITFHTEEIESGNLCDSDMELLTEMRGLAEYVPEKYPSYTFEITGCEPKEGTTRAYNEWYYKSMQIDRDSAFIATVENTDDALEIKDDFYGEVQADNEFKIFLDASKLDTKDYQAVASEVADLFKQEEITGEIYLVILKNSKVDPARGRLFSQSISLKK